MSTKNAIETYLKELLSTIRLGNSVTVAGTEYLFQTDAGASVFLEQEYTETPDTLPMVALFRGSLTSGGDIPGVDLLSNGHSYELKIEGAISDTKDGSEGDKLRGDIVKLIRSDRTLGGLAMPIIEITSQTTLSLAEDVVSLVSVTFTVQYITAIGEE